MSTADVTDLAVAAITANASGRELTCGDAKAHILKKKPQTLNTRQMKRVLARLKVIANIELNKPNVMTVAQNREDHDLRNPAVHAAGYSAIVTLDNGEEVPPYLRNNLDFTGMAVTMHNTDDLLTLHPRDSSIAASRAEPRST